MRVERVVNGNWNCSANIVYRHVNGRLGVRTVGGRGGRDKLTVVFAHVDLSLLELDRTLGNGPSAVLLLALGLALELVQVLHVLVLTGLFE